MNILEFLMKEKQDLEQELKRNWKYLRSESESEKFDSILPFIIQIKNNKARLSGIDIMIGKGILDGVIK